MTVAGRVLDAAGRSIPAARVAVLGRPRRPARGGDLSAERRAVLAQGTVDAAGRFRLTVRRSASAPFFEAHVLAAAEGHGLGWKELGLDAANADVRLDLPAEQVLRGRLLDLQG